MSVAEKRCTRCGEVRRLEEFPRHRSSRDGRHWHCRPCHRAAARERRRRYAAQTAKAVPDEKRCSTCERTLPAAAFYRDRGSADGLQYTCRDCAAAWREANADRERERKRAWREQNADREREQQREYRRSPAGRAVKRAKDARRRAAKRDRACACTSTLAVDVLLGLGPCIYCGEPAEHLEHVIALAAGGWDCMANLAPACRSCNSTKRDRPVEYLAERLAARGVEPLVETTEEALDAVPMPCWLDLIDEPEEAAA